MKVATATQVTFPSARAHCGSWIMSGTHLTSGSSFERPSKLIEVVVIVTCKAGDPSASVRRGRQVRAQLKKGLSHRHNPSGTPGNRIRTPVQYPALGRRLAIPMAK
jgi:hypothetical protein